MSVDVKIKYQAEITFENNEIKVVGSLKLLTQLNEIKKKFGGQPKLWPLIQPALTNEDILINQFIRKINQIPFVYAHDELCHCRMVKTETVCQAVLAGCRSQAEISRNTLAGTGCGACRQDIEDILKTLTA